VRWKWIDENPAKSATPPEVTSEYADPPDSDSAVRLLAAAEEHSRVRAVYLWLVLVTGARRGELCALRWADVNHAEGDLLIGGSYAVRQGQRQLKPTKTHRKRRMALDLPDWAGDGKGELVALVTTNHRPPRGTRPRTRRGISRTVGA